jgi:hypothetical protein
MDRIHWIRDLVKTEEQMEDSGIVDFSAGLDKDHILVQESILFLQTLKNNFIEASSAFNELKTSPLGRVKIYGIAKTQADFMIFRNGFKLIFSLKQPGVISVRFNFVGPNQMMPSQLQDLQAIAATPLMEEHNIIAKMGAFGDVEWMFNNSTVKMDSLIRFYMSLFIRESAK